MVGANIFNGHITDIPVRGADGQFLSSGYCQLGDTPRFELLTTSGKRISLVGDIPQWTNLQVELVSLRKEMIYAANPSINSIYPNPFNPSTEIVIDIPHDEMISLFVFDVRGTC